VNFNSKIFVAGHKGMVGSAICRKLQKEGFRNIVVRSSTELDLRNQQAVSDFFTSEKPEYVFLAAAKVGGIAANNKFRAQFIYDNILIQSNVIHHSYLNSVKKLLFLGSSCIYPKNALQPIKEEYLLQGYLEESNQPYAIAKIAGIKLCESYRREHGCNFITVLPTNLYGPNDNYNLEEGHVLSALMRKFITAKRNNSSAVTVWGSGTPRREFLHVNDLADACLYLMLNYNNIDPINVGIGKDVSITELAMMIKSIIGFEGEIIYDNSKPDGTPRKLLDITKLSNYGWRPSIDLENGIQMVYEEVKNISWD
jgi:GDP-L-fucose synthase